MGFHGETLKKLINIIQLGCCWLTVVLPGVDCLRDIRRFYALHVVSLWQLSTCFPRRLPVVDELNDERWLLIAAFQREKCRILPACILAELILGVANGI